MSDDRRVEDVLDTIGDRLARTILAEVSERPQSAKELASELDLSLPTVYRRLEMLEEHDLVTGQTLVAEDGNHYREFECNFDSTVISLDNDEYDVRIFRRENLPDRFGSLWDELGRE